MEIVRIELLTSAPIIAGLVTLFTREGAYSYAYFTERRNGVATSCRTSNSTRGCSNCTGNCTPIYPVCFYDFAFF